VSGAGSQVLDVAELDLVHRPESWAFAEAEAARIAAHWASRRAEKPRLFNGRVLLLGRHQLVRRADGQWKLSGAYFETDYANFLAWRDFGFPGPAVANAFSMAALRGADGAFLLGEMAAHTANAGNIYFPAGTPDVNDVFDGRVDLEASALRELFEETGVAAGETSFGPGWRVVYAPPRIACMKVMTLAMPAANAKSRIEGFLASESEPELARMHIVRDPRDIDEARMPAFVAEFLRAAFAQGEAG
jgi:hypothetical protein